MKIKLSPSGLLKEVEMSLLEVLFYKLTAWFPRPLPRTDSEMARLKAILTVVFGVPNTPQSWLTLVGQITSTPPNKVRKSLSAIANALHRMNFINPTAVTEKEKNIAQLQAKLEEAVRLEAEKAAAEKTADIPQSEVTSGAAQAIN